MQVLALRERLARVADVCDALRFQGVAELAQDDAVLETCDPIVAQTLRCYFLDPGHHLRLGSPFVAAVVPQAF